MLVHPAPGLIVIRPDTNTPLPANGAGSFTLTANLDGVANGVLTTGSGTALPLDVINLVWAAAPVSSWLVSA